MKYYRRGSYYTFPKGEQACSLLLKLEVFLCVWNMILTHFSFLPQKRFSFHALDEMLSFLESSSVELILYTWLTLSSNIPRPSTAESKCTGILYELISLGLKIVVN